MLNWHGGVSNRWLIFLLSTGNSQLTHEELYYVALYAIAHDERTLECISVDHLPDGGGAFGDGQAVAIHRCVTAARWTMIIGKDGRILNRRTDVSPVNDSQEVLEFIHKMLAK